MAFCISQFTAESNLMCSAVLCISHETSSLLVDGAVLNSAVYRYIALTTAHLSPWSLCLCAVNGFGQTVAMAACYFYRPPSTFHEPLCVWQWNCNLCLSCGCFGLSTGDGYLQPCGDYKGRQNSSSWAISVHYFYLCDLLFGSGFTDDFVISHLGWILPAVIFI